MFRRISRFIILILLLIAGGTLSKAVTVDETTNLDYLKMQGHSKDIVRLVEIDKARIQGTRTESRDASYTIKGKTISHKYSNMIRNIINNEPLESTKEFGVVDE